jgi:uncharacterized caspase-like protein
VSVRITRDSPAAAAPDVVKPKLYVLAVGVSEYKDANLNLACAAADAQGICEALKAQDGGLFSGVECKLLTDKDATREAIEDGFDWLIKSATQHDVAFVLVSGHGLRDTSGSYCFVPHNFDRQRIRSTAVPWSVFEDTLTSLPCKTILAMDSCHSGAAGRGERSRDLDLSDAIRELTSVEGGVVVLTSSTGKELSWEKPEWGHGAFALALIEGLTSSRKFTGLTGTALPADHNRDKFVDLIELDLYITNRVKELTEGKQHPTTDRSGTSFPLARVVAGP